MYFAKLFQGSKSAIIMRPVSIESTLLLFLAIYNKLFEIKVFISIFKTNVAMDKTLRNLERRCLKIHIL